jgi:hypothetical protein
MNVSAATLTHTHTHADAPAVRVHLKVRPTAHTAEAHVAGASDRSCDWTPLFACLMYPEDS